MQDGKKLFEMDGRTFYVDSWGGLGLESDGSLDYGGAVEAMNPDLTWVHGQGGSYQGEWMSVGVDKEGRYWLVEGSFGSCSGCDWLQAIDDEKGGREFLAAMRQRALIGETLDAALAYLSKTRENAWGDKQEAVDAVIKALVKTP